MVYFGKQRKPRQRALPKPAVPLADQDAFVEDEDAPETLASPLIHSAFRLFLLS